VSNPDTAEARVSLLTSVEPPRPIQSRSKPKGVIGWLKWDNLVVDELTEHVLFRVDDAVSGKQMFDVRPLYQGSVELLSSPGILDFYETGASSRKLGVIYDGLNIDPPGYTSVRFREPPRF